MSKYGKKAQDKVSKAMHERKAGTLKSGSGKKVTSRKQAIAIGLSEAREAGGKVPDAKNPAKKTPAKKTTSRKATAAKKSTGRKTAAKKSAPKKAAPGKKTTARKTPKKRKSMSK